MVLTINFPYYKAQMRTEGIMDRISQRASTLFNLEIHGNEDLRIQQSIDDLSSDRSPRLLGLSSRTSDRRVISNGRHREGFLDRALDQVQALERRGSKVEDGEEGQRGERCGFRGEDSVPGEEMERKTRSQLDSIEAARLRIGREDLLEESSNSLGIVRREPTSDSTDRLEQRLMAALVERVDEQLLDGRLATLTEVLASSEADLCEGVSHRGGNLWLGGSDASDELGDKSC
jgi:hypothetical protein